MSAGNENKKDLWGPKHFMGTLLEYTLFSGRWIMAPVYLGMLVTLLVLAYKFVEELIVMIEGVAHSTMHEVTLEILGLLDITLLANLIFAVHNLSLFVVMRLETFVPVVQYALIN